MGNRVPKMLIAGLTALLITVGGAGGMLYQHDENVAALIKHEYIQAVAGDATTSEAVKIAMVMGSYYESSYRHIGTPYVDKLGKGQPLTVCNGITGKGVVAGRYYTPADCYAMERERYVGYERHLKNDAPQFGRLTPLQQASFMDFLHNKGAKKWQASSMRRLLLAGRVVDACRQNERWKFGTVNDVSTVLPGLENRANANADLCVDGELK